MEHYFKEVLDTDPEVGARCEELRARVAEFASKYPMPGHEDH